MDVGYIEGRKMSNKYDREFGAFSVKFSIDTSGTANIEIANKKGASFKMDKCAGSIIASFVVKSQICDKIVKWRYSGLPDLPPSLSIGDFWIPRETAIEIFKYIAERLCGEGWDETFEGAKK